MWLVPALPLCHEEPIKSKAAPIITFGVARNAFNQLVQGNRPSKTFQSNAKNIKTKVNYARIL